MNTTEVQQLMQAMNCVKKDDVYHWQLAIHLQFPEKNLEQAALNTVVETIADTIENSLKQGLTVPAALRLIKTDADMKEFKRLFDGRADIVAPDVEKGDA